MERLKVNHVSRVSAAVIVLTAALFNPRAEAATLIPENVVRVSSTVTTPVNLTTAGPIDWAYWSQITNGASAAPSNDKSGGTAISDLGIAGGTDRQASGVNTVEKYRFTDGTSPTSATNVSLGGLVFNNRLGTNAAGKGLPLQIAGDPASERVLSLSPGGFGAPGILALTLAGIGSPGIDGTQVFTTAAPKNIAIYTLRFKPDQLGDLLPISYTAASITDTKSGQVGIEAVTVAAIPEPRAMTLGLVGMLLIFRRRGSRRGLATR